MSSEPTFTDIQDLLPLYALGALEPAEMALVEGYLRRHRELLASLGGLEEAVDLLALGAEDVALPTDARDRLLARARAERPPGGPPPLQADARGRLLARARADHAASSRRTSPPPGRPWRLATAGALVALLALAVYAGGLRGDLGRARASLESLQLENRRLTSELSERRQQLALLSAPERSVRLDSTTDDADAAAAFYLSGDTGVYVVRGLPPLPADRTYQLWLVPPGGTPTSVGLLAVAGDGELAGIVAVPAELRDFAIVDISIEPAGGSQQITRETIVLRGATS